MLRARIRGYSLSTSNPPWRSRGFHGEIITCDDAFDEDWSRAGIGRAEIQTGDGGCIIMAIDLTPRRFGQIEGQFVAGSDDGRRFQTVVPRKVPLLRRHVD
jgi:hypothetical protein